MSIVKVTTSGQISIPKELRKKIKAVYFTCELKGDGIFFRPINALELPGEKKYSMEDFRKWSFKGKNPKEKNLAGKIDSIIYKI
ncbi:MAG: AbrB/MazE/SpoVT family DNA-binding domain-containing protein [Patescibacteria group bacterium]